MFRPKGLVCSTRDSLHPREHLPVSEDVCRDFCLANNVCVCVWDWMCMQCPRSQKRSLDPPDLELQVVVNSAAWVLGNHLSSLSQPWLSWNSLCQPELTEIYLSLLSGAGVKGVRHHCREQGAVFSTEPYLRPSVLRFRDTDDVRQGRPRKVHIVNVRTIAT